MTMNDESAARQIIGVGWYFPVRVDRRLPGDTAAPGRGGAGIAMARHEDDIEQAIRVIISTSKGERKMRPTFGCDIHSLIFAPANATTFGLMRHYVDEALAMWEPRIAVTDINVVPNKVDGQVDIFVTYEVRATKDERTLVYPFYTMGEE